jgi:hypothetical protein
MRRRLIDHVNSMGWPVRRIIGRNIYLKIDLFGFFFFRDLDVSFDVSFFVCESILRSL